MSYAYHAIYSYTLTPSLLTHMSQQHPTKQTQKATHAKFAMPYGNSLQTLCLCAHFCETKQSATQLIWLLILTVSISVSVCLQLLRGSHFCAAGGDNSVPNICSRSERSPLRRSPHEQIFRDHQWDRHGHLGSPVRPVSAPVSVNL